MKELMEAVKVCPECGSGDLKRDVCKSELLCAHCGYVVRERVMDYGPEWRAFTDEQMKERTRVGPPSSPLFHDRGLMTVVGKHDKGMSPRQRARAYKLRKLQKWSTVANGKDRSLRTAIIEISNIASQLGLPRSVKETAAMIYRGVSDKNEVRGRSIENMAAAAVFMACRQHKIPRTLNEIVDVSRTRDKKIINRCFRTAVRALSAPSAILHPVDFIFRAGAELKIDSKTQNKALELLKTAQAKSATHGLSPQAVAAAIIYTASIITKEYITQREVAKVMHLSEVTVRSCYRRLCQKLGKAVMV